jgi:hypothetical protein
MKTVILSLLMGAAQDRVVFPDDAGIVNVRVRYGARGDGVTDDTAAIQKAIDEMKGVPDALYFPDGIYLLSAGVGIFGGKAHSSDRFLNLQGQSEAGTVLRLKDGCPGFDDPKKPRIVLSLYEGQGTGDVMHSYCRNLTVDVGRGNPGAVGVRFMSNNSGAMSDVTIRSSDPQGAGLCGLDLTQGQVGPCLLQHITVIGFDIGAEVAHTFSVVFEHLTLRSQNEVGFLNRDGRATLRGLRSANRVTAVRNTWQDLTLLDADLRGGSAERPAIVNGKGSLFLRDIRQEGYGQILIDAGGESRRGAAIDEWHTGKTQSLFPSDQRSLRLPIQETPVVPWETDLSRWVKVDWTRSGEDVSQAFQEAIDRAAREGATTIYLPRRPRTHEYPRLTRPIRVHGTVNRIIGMSNILDVSDPGGALKDGRAIFTIQDLKGPAIVFERWFLLGGWKGPRDAFMFDNRSGKALVIRNMGISGKLKRASTGGECYIEDVPAPGLHLGPGEKCWARQYNPESPEADMISVDGGQLWILGLKTEGRSRHVVARNGAKVEILGGVSYQSWVNQPIDPPMFTLVDSEASFTFGFYHWNQPFTTIVEETSGGQKRLLSREALERYHLPLYRSGAARR